MARSLKITGLDQLKRKLKQNINMDDVKRVVKMNAAEMNSKASRNAPVDTGFLRRSIIFEMSNGGLSGSSTAGAEYAPYLEYGTRFMEAQPFMGPAYRAQKETFKRDMDRLVK